MKNLHITGPKNMNNPQGHMARYGSGGGPKDTSHGRDLSRNATNVIAKLGNSPKANTPNANSRALKG